VSILLLVAAVICWAVAALPGFITIAEPSVSWGWMGCVFFGIWLLIGGAPAFLARVRG
jgi:hypothetical protein